MGIPQWVEQLYTENRPYFDALDVYVLSSLDQFCQHHEYSFRHRVKSKGSVAEKLESGRYPSWWDIDDFVGATVVVPNLTHESLVLAHLDSLFSDVRVRSRATAITPPDVFRFNSTRWYGRVRLDPPPPLPTEAMPIVFEVQIMTAFEHAWQIATHDLAFKGGGVNWQEMRLAASMKAAVEQIDNMVANFVDTAASIKPSPFPETAAKAHVIEVFEDLLAEGVLPESLRPEVWSRFAHNLWSLVGTLKRGPTTAPAVIDLVDRMAMAIRSEEFVAAISGSLFQAVYVFAVQMDPKYLKKFRAVPSGELSEVYGLTDLPFTVSADRTD